MSLCVFDTETTTFQKGNPFARRNRLCYVGSLEPGRGVLVGDATEFSAQRHRFDDSSTVVGFNIKFDLHWLRREYGWVVGEKRRVWDCQLAHFLLTAQRHPYPSLEEVRDYLGIKRLSPKGAPDYWARGIDTPDIPREIMLEDLRNDVLDTWEVYKKQLELISTMPKLYNLFRLHCDDLVVLAEMEWNGLPFNEEKAKAEADKLRAAISNIEEELRSHCQGVPINFDSPEHISAFLYGGIIKETKKILVGIYKSGGKAGQPRYNNREVEYALPQMVKPLEGSSLAKDGYWSTDESVLRQLTGAKKIRDLLLERSKLSKELDYMQGLPDLIDEMDWPRNSLHGSFNQCVASTGRLSSSRPNQQNLTDSVLQLIESQRN